MLVYTKVCPRWLRRWKKNGNEGIEMTNENEMKKEEGDLISEKKYASIQEIDAPIGQGNVLRVYCTSVSGEGFNFQIRTFKPITFNGKGKPRAMIATTSLTISEVENILAYMKRQIHKYDPKPAKKEGASPSSAKDEDMIISPRGARQIKARQDACQHDFVSDGNRNGSVMYERCEKCGITKGAV
jgi:hypothetical protein